MANWSTLKSAVNNAIKTNGSQQITGQALQNVLNNIITSLGENATFAGIATPSTSPGTPDGNVFYIATQPGEYSNFSQITIEIGEIAVLKWSGTSWTKKIISVYEWQCELCDSHETTNGGWGNISIQNNVEINYLGNSVVANKITVNKASDSGSLIGFFSQHNVRSSVGDRVNFCLYIHSEVESTVSYSLYPNIGTVKVSTNKIENGWNKVYAECNITKSHTEDFNLQLIIADNTDFIGSTIYTRGYWYVGERKDFIANLDNIYVRKEAGKVLIPESTALTMERLDFVDFAKSISSQGRIHDKAGSGFVYKATEEGLTVKKSAGVGSSTGSWSYITFMLDDGMRWESGHEYYIAIDMVVNVDSKLSDGKFSQRVLSPKYDSSTIVGTVNSLGELNRGDRGLYTAKFTIDNSNIATHPTANQLFFQFGQYYVDEQFDGVVYGAYVSDLGLKGSDVNISWDEVDSYVREHGFVNKSIVDKSCYAIRARTADELTGASKDIDIWGDSLTAQNWGNYLMATLGRKVYSHGYGGKTSTYIRDLFLENVDHHRTQIIWVGRNNYTEVDVIIDDIRDMIAAFGCQNFLIMSPPNGNYGTFSEDGQGDGEMKGGENYKRFIELEERLSMEYQNNYLNIRRAVIQGWRMGNVKLLSEFIQPVIGGTVMIEVSDADFLTTYNSEDLSVLGETTMKKIRIGLNGIYDVYSVLEKSDSKHLTVRLESANYMQPGETVCNKIDNGGTNAVKYLRVMQNADYICWMNDITLSTYRSDRIHISEDGRRLVAEIVARKIKTMGI